MDLPDDARRCLHAQHGLASRDQLISAGVTGSALRWRLQREWRMPLPGVVATFTGALDPAQRLIAAQLYGGPGAVLASWTAAAWYGVTAAESPVVRIVVPASRAARGAGFVVVTRTTRPDREAVSRPPLLVASQARAVADAAREVRGQQAATRLVIEAVQKRVISPPSLRHELACGPRGGSRQLRLALACAETGAWSAPEAELVQLVARSTVLPEAWPNATLSLPGGRRLPTPDLWFDNVALAVQVHSRAYHARDADWDGTVMGDSALVEAGVVVLGVTPARIRRDPTVILRRIEGGYRALLGRPRPDVVARRRVLG